ncbi:MAG TPA: isoleucine--tRNA ligase, partial [Waddliaceae bacterium]
WVFKQLYDKGLVYQGYKVMPYSAKLGTPLSNFEAGENYREVDDPSLTVAFPLIDDPYTSLLAWTTTPWTLISNMAIMVGPEIDYVKIKERSSGKKYILAEAKLADNFKNPDEYEVLETLKGKQLEGRRYHNLFPYFADKAALGAFRVILEPSVSIDEGTGIVHSAPAFGEVDFYACKREDVPLVCPVDSNGRFMEQIPEHQGLFVKDADKAIIKRLKEMGRIFHQGTCHHRYPFCWRSDTPLIYMPVSTWFVAVEKFKSDLYSCNEQIHWMPEHLKAGRFGKWLEGARDWAISRNRYWGTPIPIWQAEDGEIIVIGSIKELKEATGAKISDLHRHFIDGLPFTYKGKQFSRIPEVFDCWFESGSMPYAQNHYPFENTELFKDIFPADFIAEGLDQTRAWFYTLTILSAALFKKPAFKNVIVNGIVLASDGAKMSKRLRNYPNPMEVVKKYGADSIRLYMMHSGAVKAEDLRFTESGVELILRQILIPLWNAYSFFITYAHIYKWTPSAYPKPDAIIDQWILSLLNKLIKDVAEGMDKYDLSHAVEPFVAFVDQLTNWYIRRNRRRFWDEEATQDREQAFATLYQVLLNLTKIAAPFIPFISDAMYRNLRSPTMSESVHLCDYPVYHAENRNHSLEAAMDAVQRTVSLGHALRKEHKIKVRQPLPSVHIASPHENILDFLKDQQHLIAEELNVKKVDFSSDETEFVTLKAKPNFRVLGKKAGKFMKSLHELINKFSRTQLETLLNGNHLVVAVEGEQIELTTEDVTVDRTVLEGMIAASEGDITLALDVTLNEELLLEGLAREIVNKINTMRRDASLDVSDRIRIKMQTTGRVQKSFDIHRDYICNEVLAISAKFEDCEGTTWDLNGEPSTIFIEKA